MIGVLYTKTFQTALLSTLLFYVLANPDTFKMVRRIPGLKFVMKSTNEITHSGVITHALLFGVVLFLCVLLINKTLVQHFPFLNVVEHFLEDVRNRINAQCNTVVAGEKLALARAALAHQKCAGIIDPDDASGWSGLSAAENQQGTRKGSDANTISAIYNSDTVTDTTVADYQTSLDKLYDGLEDTAKRKCSEAMPEEETQKLFCPSDQSFNKSGHCHDFECGLTKENRKACCT